MPWTQASTNSGQLGLQWWVAVVVDGHFHKLKGHQEPQLTQRPALCSKSRVLFQEEGYGWRLGSLPNKLIHSG